MTIRFAVGVWFVGLLSIVSSVGGMDVIQAEKGPATNAEYAPVNTCCWKTYTSETYGFEMKYPQDLAVQEEIPLAVIEGAVIRLSLVNHAYYDGTNLVEAFLFVGVTPEKACSSRETACTYEGRAPTETRNVAGVTFTRTSFWEGAAGNQYSVITYSAPHAGNCYRLTLFTHCINVQVYDPGTVAEFDSATVLRLFDQVTSTFQFLKRIDRCSIQERGVSHA